MKAANFSFTYLHFIRISVCKSTKKKKSREFTVDIELIARTRIESYCLLTTVGMRAHLVSAELFDFTITLQVPTSFTSVFIPEFRVFQIFVLLRPVYSKN
jgi:hypothetical protein